MAMIKLAHEDEERSNAASVLWVLAFDEDNRTIMKETEGLLDILHSMKENTNNHIKKAVNGALWELEGKQNHAIEPAVGGMIFAKDQLQSAPKLSLKSYR